MKKIFLKINSKKIPLNPFVSLFMIKTIEGMVSSLRGAGKNIFEIEITIKEEPNSINKREEKI